MAGTGPEAPGGLDEDDTGAAGFSEINIVPLVDIMLVLLVILMATSTAMITPPGEGEGSGFRVNLPSGSAEDSIAKLSDELVVVVLEDGTVVAGGAPVTEGELEALFAAEAAKDRQRLVLVQADERSYHRRVVEVMEAARRAGLENLAIATRPERE